MLQMLPRALYLEGGGHYQEMMGCNKKNGGH